MLSLQVALVVAAGWALGVLALVLGFWYPLGPLGALIVWDALEFLRRCRRPFTNLRGYQGIHPWMKRIFWTALASSWWAKALRKLVLLGFVASLTVGVTSLYVVDDRLTAIRSIRSPWCYCLGFSSSIVVTAFYAIRWCYFTPIYSRPAIVAINRIEADFATFFDSEEAPLLPDSLGGRQYLHETWTRQLFPNPRLPKDFLLVDGTPCGVPCTLEGLCQPNVACEISDMELHPLYTNIRYPFRRPGPPYTVMRPSAAGKGREWWNPTGVWTCEFKAASDLPGEETLLVFEGAGPWMAVWLNQEFVGVSTDYSLPAAFSVSDTLVSGRNRLVVVIPRFSCTSYIEDQDQWWTAGIIRPVFLFRRPLLGLHRVSTSTRTFSSETRGPAELTVHVECPSGTTGLVQVRLLQPGATNATQDTLESIEMSLESLPSPASQMGSKKTVNLTIRVEDAVYWTPATPQLYTVLVLLCDGSRKQVKSCRVGFREVSISESQVRLNGRPIFFRGVNLHDSDPYLGKIYSDSLMKRDLRLLKALNVNTVGHIGGKTQIRTAHMPKAAAFYDACDAMGFLVIDEANCESHGDAPLSNWRLLSFLCIRSPSLPVSRMGHDHSYRALIHSRFRRMLHRDAGRTCVVMWSLGNEAGGGPTFNDLYTWSRATDSRPVHYESCDSPDTCSDVCSWMYPPVQKCAKYCRRMTGRRWLSSFWRYRQPEPRPLFLCEFAHMMGNSSGQLRRYVEFFRSEPLAQGGCIWDVADQGLMVKRRGRDLLARGGSFNESPHDGNFLNNGFLTADRRLKPVCWEIRRAYAPVDINSVLEVRNGALHVMGHLTSYFEWGELADHFDLALEAFASTATPVQPAKPAGEPPYLATGQVPLQTVSVQLPASSFGTQVPVYAKAAAAGVDSVSWVLRHRNGQEAVRVGVPLPAVVRRATPTACLDFHMDSAGSFMLHAGSARCVIDSETGALTRLVIRERSLLAAPVQWLVWRAPTENDRGGLNSEFGAVEAMRQSGLLFGLYGACKQRDRATQGPWSYESQWRHLREMSTVLDSAEAVAGGFRVRQILVCRWTLATITTVYRLLDARVHLSVSATVHAPWKIPRLGLQLSLPAGDDCKVTYRGLGPCETYADRRWGAVEGTWVRCPDGAEVRLQPRPAEAGGVECLQWFEVQTGDAVKVRVDCAGSGLHGSFLPWTAEEIAGAAYPDDLPPSRLVHCVVDLWHMDLGGEVAWYPHNDRFIEPNKVYRCDLTISTGKEAQAAQEAQAARLHAPEASPPLPPA
ncbi:MAG: hypothetical protein KVP17_001846 [Porospora cf. gigantea B]|uniref:uncharacterized protein n=1 Tax=Porospora cf. gigantea B TaxID=2853592 RepID=UPI003571B649|nr:MAG: hypothetical protein KVP17_001846 [Porospora cf. gigantea B]